jgi:WhiB family transcriptional regulator, redox-sensing transcriptional regulator
MTTSSAHGLSYRDGDDWRSKAACRGMDPEDWFPESARGRDAKVIQTVTELEAKATCLSCDVADECLARALEIEGGKSTANRFGIWGGLTPKERAAVARRRRR